MYKTHIDTEVYAYILIYPNKYKKQNFGTVDYLGILLDTTVCSYRNTTVSIYPQEIAKDKQN